jgi:hypothetical protein
VSGYCTEVADVYTDAVRRERKDHHCCACQEVIRAGDDYSLTTVIGDGIVSVYKRCLRCQKIHVHLRTLSGLENECWPDERLDCGYEYSKHWDRPPPPEIAELAFVTPDEMQARRAAKDGSR